MVIEIGTLITMAVQIGTSLYNQYANKKNLAEVKKLQQEAKTAAQKRSLERDYSKFKRACELQIQIEEDAHIERLSSINQDLLNSFEKLAHNENLKSHYPLNISPYVIGHSVIPLSGTQINHSRQEVLCILTNSNDKSFNKDVIPYIDRALCNLISTYWNHNSLHTMCYFSNVWNEKFLFCNEDIDNLKSTIVTPTLAVTPYIEKDEEGYSIVIKLNMWGIGSEVSSQISTPLHVASLPQKYSTQEIDDIVSKLVPTISCVIAQNVDVYYWASYYLPPLLPSLITQKNLLISQEMQIAYTKIYTELYKILVLNGYYAMGYDLNETDNILMKDILDSNLFLFPNRSIEFLKSCIELLGASETSNQLIGDSIRAIYEVKTGNKCNDLSLIDLHPFNYDDMKIVTELTNIANKSGNISVAKELKSLIRRKILSQD